MTYSDKDWPANKDRAAIGVKPFAPAGHDFPGGVKSGDVAVVLGYCVEQFHARVERLGEGCWGHSYRDNKNRPGQVSRHARGIAVDINAPRHPNGKRGTFSKAQRQELQEIAAEVGNVVRWGEFYTGTTDGMHLEINDSKAAVAEAAKRLRGARKEPSKATPAWFVRDLFRGCTGHDVVVARHNLHLPAGDTPGVWDSALERAVRTFQSKNNIPVTGRIDGRTAKAIG